MPRSSSPSSSVFASIGDAPSRNADARAFPSVRASRRVAARGDAMTPARGRRRGVDASAFSTVDAKPLPRILRDWARHHVELFVRDGDSDAHSIVSDYDGNALSVDARRAVHEEARRRGVRARSEEHSRDGGAKIVTLRRGDDATGATSRGEEDGVDDADDADDEAFARWTEACGYEDMRDEPFDLYAELKISKENANPAGRARAAYHREAMKWHPDRLLTNGGSAGFCDACQSVLRFNRWHRAHERGERGRDFCAHCVATSKRSIAGREWDRKHNTAPLVVDGESVVVTCLDDLASERATYESRIESGRTKAATACRKLQRLGIAFSVLKDRERFEIYRDHGYTGLVKSERHAEVDVFDLDGFSVYDSFFAGENEDDRQYLLLCPDAESDDDAEDANVDAAADDDDAEDEVQALLAENKEAVESAPKRRRNDDDVDFPLAPIAVRVAGVADAHTNDSTAADPWAELAKRIGE